MRSNVKDAVISLIDQEREGEKSDQDLLKNVLGVFVEIGEGSLSYYVNDFEAALLEDTATYYCRKAASWISEYSHRDYLLKAEECLRCEKERVIPCLNPSSEQNLLEKVKHELLSKHASQLLEKVQCHALLRNDKHVITQGTILLEQAEDAARDKKRARKDIVSLQQEAIVSIVIETHALHAKYLQYVSGYFSNHHAFHKALRQSFELICNKELAGTKHAKCIVTFFDNILKKGGSEKLCHEDIETTLAKVDDLKLARESQTNFEVYLNDNANISLGIDLTVTILTTSFWPSYKSFELNLPFEMAKCVDSFKDFYQTKTKHRKLKWIYSLGKCNVIGMFDAKPIELIVTPCQAAALLLFNASEKLSYLDIKSQLNLIDEDIVRLLHSLACAKYKILNKTPDTKVFAPTDYFEFNTTFTDRKGRIKIPLSPLDDRKKVNEDVDKKRHNAIDASIVRIMKRRKILPYQQLVNKCVEQLAHMFKPDFQAIKRQIEDLIGNE